MNSLKGKSNSFFKKVFECIEETALKCNVTNEFAAFIIDKEKLPGIYYSYIYFNDKKIIRNISDEDDLSKDREEAELIVDRMAVNITGARKGEILMGVRENLSKGAIMKIKEGIVPVMKRDLAIVMIFKDVWDNLIKKLDFIDFFKNKTRNEKEFWLINNQKDGDFDIAEVKDLKVEFLEVGKSKFLELDQEIVTEILSGKDEGWNPFDIREKFPRKPGSKTKRPTLMFFNHFWKIAVTSKIVNNYKGVIFDMENKKFIKEENKRQINIYSGLLSHDEKKQDLGIIFSKDKQIKNNNEYFKILLEKNTKFTIDDIEKVKYACRNFTAAGYKSLLQKIIRYSPINVTFNGGSYPSYFFLDVVFTLLLVNSGSFVPDIQRFVTGQESAIKRLAICILEDSSIKNNNDILMLGIMAFLSQRSPNGWKPSKNEYLWMLDLCRESLENREYYIHNIKKGFEIPDYILDIKNNDLENFSALLDDIKSFATDLAMTRFISYNKGKTSFDKSLERPLDMRVEHCIDQHWAPEIAYFIPQNIIKKYRETGSKPFAKLFKNIFMNVTGVNSRKQTTGLSGHKISEDKEFISSVKIAQYLVLTAKQTSGDEFKSYKKNKNGYYTVEDTLDISWISGLVGPIDIKGKPSVMVTMKPDDPYQLIAIKKPSRGMKDGTLSDDVIEKSIEKAKDLMRKGISLNGATSPIERLKGYKLKLEDEKYIFIKGKETPKSWDELAVIEEDIWNLDEPDDELNSFLMYRGDGIIYKGHQIFEETLSKYSIGELRRAYSYISSFRSDIEIARLSKDGGGTAQTVVIEDVGACQILLYICMLFPAAIERVEGYVSKFKVKFAPLLWEIKNKLREHIETINKSDEKIKGWKKVKDNSKRELRSYQQDSINEMINKNKDGKKGHFIWITAGLGKTMIVMEYLKYLIDSNKAPKYIVYTLPKSALKSIITEIEHFKFPINLVIPIKSWKKHPESSKYTKEHDQLLPFHINLIEHDHLRLMEETLIDNASQSIFIIDEVHKALNDTKRTGVALEISRLSKEFVALTGTPIVDSNTYKLIWWLEQIVEFEVNDKNFWVAANGMIAKKVNTGVDIDREEIVSEFTEKERVKYNELSPVSIGGKNQKPNSKDITELFNMCYNICDRDIIEQTLLSIKKTKKSVMIVTRDTKHQEKLRKMFVEKGMKDKDIYLLKGDDSIFMTDETVKEGKIHDYKVIIVTIRKAEGYTLTRAQTMITSVYPSNNAVREQLEARINRVSQHEKKIYYKIVHCGILTYVLKKHKDAASISKVLQSLAEDVEFE
jgi:superfamily II DNA or RNA helicase